MEEEIVLSRDEAHELILRLDDVDLCALLLNNVRRDDIVFHLQKNPEGDGCKECAKKILPFLNTFSRNLHAALQGMDPEEFFKHIHDGPLCSIAEVMHVSERCKTCKKQFEAMFEEVANAAWDKFSPGQKEPFLHAADWLAGLHAQAGQEAQKLDASLGPNIDAVGAEAIVDLLGDIVATIAVDPEKREQMQALAEWATLQATDEYRGLVLRKCSPKVAEYLRAMGQKVQKIANRVNVDSLALQ